MPSVISGDANVSATEFGYLDGVTSALQTQMDAKLPLAGGKILQVVRATDSTARSTTSATDVDVTGMSVTITPSKSTSAILLLAVYVANNTRTSATAANAAVVKITDSSNNTISGADLGGTLYVNEGETVARQIQSYTTMVGYSTPATTSATTYKLRFNGSSGTTTIRNDQVVGQMYAIEVSA